MNSRDMMKAARVESLVLKRVKHGASQVLGTQTLQDLSVEALSDFLGECFYFQITTEMLEHKDGTETQHVRTTVPGPKPPVWLFLVSAVLLGVGAIAAFSGVYSLAALVDALNVLVFMIYVTWPKRVTRTFEVTAEQWTTFPHNDYVYDHSPLGQPVVQIRALRPQMMDERTKHDAITESDQQRD